MSFVSRIFIELYSYCLNAIMKRDHWQVMYLKGKSTMYIVEAEIYTSISWIHMYLFVSACGICHS